MQKAKVSKGNEKRIGVVKDTSLRPFVKVNFVRLTDKQLKTRKCNAYQYVV